MKIDDNNSAKKTPRLKSDNSISGFDNKLTSDMVSVACPLCHKSQLKLINRIGQFGLPTNVAICTNDGFTFLSPRWTNNRYLDFYSKEYDNYYRPVQNSKNLENVNLKNAKKILNRLKTNGIFNARHILDFGAGDGKTLEFLKQNLANSPDIAAVEASRKCLNELRQKNIKIVGTDFDSDWHLNFEKTFDLIIMRHVLEHSLDPIKTLEKINFVLKEDGRVYIAVPDMMHPKGSLSKHWFRVVHTFYFSQQTLTAVAAKSNLTPKIIKNDKSELWGIFGLMDQPSILECSVRNYYQQMLVILIHRIKRFALTPFRQAKRLLIKWI